MILRKSGLHRGATATRHARSLTGLWLAMAVGLVAALLSQAGLFHGAQVRSTDFLFRAADTAVSDGVSSEHVVVVAIDDHTLAQFGSMTSWPRTYYATLTQQLSAAGASVIAYDLLFSESASGDDEFAAAIGLAGNVVLPVVETSVLRTGHAEGSESMDTGSYERPLPILETAAVATGHANVFPDADGVVRRVPMSLPSPAGSVPAFSAAVAELYVGLPDHSSESGKEGDSVAGQLIPLDATGSMIINYTTVVGPHSPRQFSFVDVLEGSADMSVFDGRIVLIGATAVGLQDMLWTPCGRLMSGVLVHGSAIATIVSGAPLQRTGGWPMGLVALGLAIAAWLMATRLGTLRALAALAATLALYVATVFVAFDHGLLLDMLYPPGSLVASFATVSVYGSASERARRRKLASTFGRFVSAPVASQIMAALEDGAITLGGTQRQATILFADIRGFTNLAARTEPQQLVRAVNAYLAVAIDAVNEEGGMVNKFGGDSIMAVWNAPTDSPQHTLCAVRAGLRIQQRTAVLTDTDNTLPSLAFGIGINTGDVVAGTFGTEERLEYSVLGDAVNVASRVTSLAPGGAVWLTEYVARTIADRVSLQDLGFFSLKGKDDKVHLLQATGLVTRGTEQVGTQSDAVSHQGGTVTNTPTPASFDTVNTTNSVTGAATPTKVEP